MSQIQKKSNVTFFGTIRHKSTLSYVKIYLVKKMNIYDTTNNQYQFPILDPDFSYQQTDYQKNLYPFFKQLDIPLDVHFLTGIYIDYYIDPYSIEEYPQLYFHVSRHLVKKVEDFLDFGHAHLYYERSNFFFLVMFNIAEEQIEEAFIKLHLYLKDKKFEYLHQQCSFFIKCGIYVSTINIHPYKLFDLSKEQCQQILSKEKTFISVHNLKLLR